jgi:hypothetical protein
MRVAPGSQRSSPVTFSPVLEHADDGGLERAQQQHESGVARTRIAGVLAQRAGEQLLGDGETGARPRRGKTLFLADAEVRAEDDRLIAHGTSTLMRLPGRGLRLGIPMFAG